MPTRIPHVNRIPQTIGISVQAALPKRAQGIRLIETHQDRIESSITITQQIMPGHRISTLPVEARHVRALQAMAVRAVDQRLTLLRRHSMQHAALYVSPEHIHSCSGTFRAVLSQQMASTLKDAAAHRALYLDRQTTLLIEAQH